MDLGRLGSGFGRAGSTTVHNLSDNLSDFTYDLDFVANTYKNGTQPYGNNNNDGRFFRDPNNVAAVYCEDNAGTLVLQPSAGLRRTSLGHIQYPGSTVVHLWNRDLTQAGTWTATNVTALKDQVGRDGVANAASSITATAINGTIFQTITQTSRTYIMYCDVKRLVGTGTLEYTLDGGATWTSITTTASYTRPLSNSQTLANPTFGFRIGTSGDSFAVDFVMAHGQLNAQNIPNGYRIAIVGSAGTLAQSRPNAATADAGPLATIARGAFAFYWEGECERAIATGPYNCMTGDVQMACQVDTAGAVHFQSAVTGNAQWKSAIGLGPSARNKVAGYVTAGGISKVCCNGNAVASASGVALASSLAHFDLGTNGAGVLSIHGINRRFAMSANLTFSDAGLIAMTT